MISGDLNIKLLTIATANIWKLSGVELRNILIQLGVEMARTYQN
jgi:hypothetical protein